MSCNRCGCATSNRLCRACERDERRATRTVGESFTGYDCPDCGGVTSGQGITCYRCRGGSQ